MNSDILYYQDDKANSFKLKVEENDAILEILYDLNALIEYSTLNLEKLEFNLSQELTIIKIPNNIKKIDVKLQGGEGAVYTIYHGYSILPYTHFFNLAEEDRMKLSSFEFSINDPYDENIKLMKDEYYIIMIGIFSGEINVKINIEKKEEKKEEKKSEGTDEEKGGLENYQIALIIVGAILFIILVIVIIFIILRKRKLKNNEIEEINKMNNERILE